MSNQGFIALHRKIQDHPFWKERREFSRAEAWIDILMEVQHEQDPQRVIIGNRVFICNRGESLKSLDTWAKRWGWSKSGVRRFFDLLNRMNQVTIQSETVTVRLKVCNYETYNKLRNATETQLKRNRNATETHLAPDNNENNENNDILPPTPEVENVESLLNSAYASMTEKRAALVKEWVKYRQELKKPMKTVSGVRKFLAEIDRDYQDDDFLAESMSFTMSKEWQGLRPAQQKITGDLFKNKKHIQQTEIFPRGL